MKFRPAAWILILAAGGGVLLAFALGAPAAAPTAYAQPPSQRATEEPTKPPYVFPTPIFIPTYSGQPGGPPATPVVSGPAAPAPSGERTYTVVAGDSPWTISTKVYGVGTRSDVIMRANGISDPTRLKVGMVLKIPATDASGQPLPVPVPTVAPTPVPPVAVATVIPTPATPVATPTPVPGAAGGLPGVVLSAVGILINLLAAFFLIGAILTALLSWLMYRRTRRLAQMNVLARRIRLR